MQFSLGWDTTHRLHHTPRRPFSSVQDRRVQHVLSSRLPQRADGEGDFVIIISVICTLYFGASRARVYPSS